MSEEKEVRGEFIYDQDSKRYHRFQVEADEGVVGIVYIPKTNEKLPDKLVLERKRN